MHFTNNYNLPQSIVDVIKSKNDWDRSQTDPLRIGVTTLNNPPRIRMLSIKHWNKIEGDVSNYIWMILGDAVHWVLSKTNKENRLIEEKIEEKVDGIVLVGKPDLYDNITKTIEDFKITSVWRVKEIKNEWTQQVNAYSWFLQKAGFVTHYAYINAILKDWSELEKKRFGRDYPPIPFKRMQVPLWSFEEQQRFIEERIKIHKESINLPDEKLPLCSEEERWKIPDKWAIYKGKNKIATKLCSSYKEADMYINNIKNKTSQYKIVKREGIDNRCIKYCICNKFCDYYKKTYEK